MKISNANNEKDIINIKLNVPGNKEPLFDEIKSICKKICDKNNFHLKEISVLYDDDHFSRIFIEIINSKFLNEYISGLEKDLKILKNPKNYIENFRKAFNLANHFNNMFGSGIHNKDKELNELEKFLETIKSI